MVTAAYKIRFEFLVEAPGRAVTLEADVQEHHFEAYFKITNFRFPGHPDRSVLPEITIRKQSDRWVHTDSGKSTDLSIAAGAAIDAGNRNKAHL